MSDFDPLDALHPLRWVIQAATARRLADAAPVNHAPTWRDSDLGRCLVEEIQAKARQGLYCTSVVYEPGEGPDPKRTTAAEVQRCLDALHALGYSAGIQDYPIAPMGRKQFTVYWE